MPKILLIILMTLQIFHPFCEVFGRAITVGAESNPQFLQQEQPHPSRHNYHPNLQPSDREISSFVNDLIAFGKEGALRIANFIWRLFGPNFFKDFFVN